MEFPVAALSPVYENVLADVTAYVEVWSSSRRENYSKTFSQQLLNLGAKVSKTFNKHVTHVIFKDGHQGTWDKAVKAGVKLVSVLWVEKCREAAAHIDESGFPAINTNDGLPQIVKKKHKCMQPKDFVEKTPENDRRMQRKFDEMSKALKVQKVAVDDPVLLFDEYGTLMYSPKAVAADRCNAMEKRIKEMKNKRENLSPTASQISQPFDFLPIKPSIGYSPSALNSPIDNGSADLDTSYDELWGSLEKKETISNGWKNKATSKKTVIGATELEDPNCQINSINSSINLTPPQSKDKKNNHAIPSFQKKTRKSLAKSKNVENPGESVMNCGTPSAVYSSVDYAALTNKFTVKCEENVRTRKARSSSLKSKTPASNKKTVVPEIPKFSDVTTAGDSEGTCSSFEDFFSVDMKSQKRPFTRFSLGTLPPKSPTSPLLVINKKGSSRKRRRSEQNLGELNSSSGKRRRKSISKKDILVDSEAAEFESLHDAKTMPTVGDCIGSNPMDASKNKTVRSDQVNNNGTTSISLSTSTTNVNIKDKLIMSSEITQKEDTCLVKGMEKIAELMACKQSPNQTVMKNCTGCEKQEEEPKRFKKYAESKYPASNGLSKFLNEQRNKCNDNEELKKKEKIRKISGSLVMTSMCSEKQNTVIQVVKKFGGFVFSDHVCETTTHVIAGSPRRTLNIILGIARGCWIISYDWVLWSLECGHWISEEPYELSDHFPGAPIGRLQRHLSAGEYQQDLLSSLPAVFISPSSQPPCDKLSEVVQLCGGKVCKALRQAKICIGKFNGKRAPDVQNVSEKWLLDSITQHRLHPLENYLLDQ